MPNTPQLPFGFAGLSTLLSDRHAELGLAAARAIAAPKKDKDPAKNSSTSASGPVPVVTVPGDGRSSHTWFGRLVLVGIGLVILVAYLNDNKKPTYSPSYAPSTSPSYSSQPRASPTPAAPAPVSSFTERIPARGQGLALDEPEVRYCLAQKIRIEGVRSVINNYSQDQVDRFNQLIDQYNSRCSSYRYKQSIMDRVRPEVENRRGILFLEGQNLLR